MCTNELTSKIKELKELQRMQEELADEITTLQDEIKAEMIARETEEMLVDIFKVRWTTVVSNRFDSTALKKTHADLYNQYTKESKSKRFTIL